MKTNEIVWVALDLPTLDEAERMASILSNQVAGFKIGLELFTRYGPKAVESIKKYGRIFLDLKLHDIPNTVAHAISQLSELGVDYLTLHSLGGRSMLEAAREAKDKAKTKVGKPPKLLAVTVLTSLFTTDLIELGIEQSPKDLALKLARLAKSCEIDGVVASAYECKEIKKKLGQDFIVATPAIRPVGFEKSDQKRVVTPKKAIEAGANILVIGRPITQSPQPLKVLDDIAKELQEI